MTEKEAMEFYNEGASAYDAGVMYEQCPYSEETNPVKRDHWQRGWIDKEAEEIAFQEEEF